MKLQILTIQNSEKFTIYNLHFRLLISFKVINRVPLITTSLPVFVYSLFCLFVCVFVCSVPVCWLGKDVQQVREKTRAGGHIVVKQATSVVDKSSSINNEGGGGNILCPLFKHVSEVQNKNNYMVN